MLSFVLNITKDIQKGESEIEYFKQWEALPVEVGMWQTHSRGVGENALYRKVADIIQEDCESVLDVGCGIGLDKRYFEIDYLGLDVTPKFVAECRKRFIPTLCASALCLPISDKSFDCVYANSLLVHMPPELWKDCLREMVRAARKMVVSLEGDWHQITEYVKGERYFSNNQLLEFYNNAYGATEICEFMLSLGITDIEPYQGARKTQGTIFRVH